MYSVSSSFDMESSQVLHNKVTGGSCGGLGIYRCEVGSLKDSNVSHNVAQFYPSSSAIASGGGMCLELSSHIVVENSNFEYNFAASTGGGIKILQSATVAIQDSSLNNNHAGKGGAIALLSSANATVGDVIMKNNSAINDGGSIDVEESLHVEVKNSKFVRSLTHHGHGSSIA